jgi:hypothetical protein
VDLRVERGQPRGQRRFRRQDQGHEGPATQPDEGGGLDLCHESGVSVGVARVNTNRVPDHKMLWILLPGTATDGNPGVGALGWRATSGLAGLGRMFPVPVRKGLVGGASGTSLHNRVHT